MKMSALDARAGSDGHLLFNCCKWRVMMEIVNRLNSIEPLGKITGIPKEGTCVFTCHTHQMGASFAEFLKRRGIKVDNPREAEGGGMFSVYVHADYESISPLYVPFNDEYFSTPQIPEEKTDEPS